MSTPAELPSTHRPSRRWVGIALVTAVVVLQHVAISITNRDLGRLVSVLLIFAFEIPILFLGLNTLFGWAGRRGLKSPAVVGLGMVLAGTIGAVAGALFWVVAERWPELQLHVSSTQPVELPRMVLFGFTQAQSHFGLWTLAYVLPLALEDAQLRKLEAEKLRSLAELSQLRANLEPHFLLNTLNAIAGLVTEDPREARRLLAALGDLLRDALRDANELQGVGAQMTWLQRYAAILEARHRGDLTFSWDIAPDVADVQLPRLLLQPLVENAVKHGALKRTSLGHVSVRVALGAGGTTLVCEVCDDGPGFVGEPVREGAFGLQSVRRRIALRYGEHGTLSLASTAEGTRALVEVPL
ncbi:MAG: histidine kinase [Archangium sp.]|nr:histidine kinase [Archangium sp.]